MVEVIQITRILFRYHSSSIRLITDLGLSLGWPLAIRVGRHLVKMIFCSDLVNRTKMLINDWSLFADNHMMWVRGPRNSHPSHLGNNHCFSCALVLDPKPQFQEETKQSSCKQTLATETMQEKHLAYACLVNLSSIDTPTLTEVLLSLTHMLCKKKNWYKTDMENDN